MKLCSLREFCDAERNSDEDAAGVFDRCAWLETWLAKIGNPHTIQENGDSMPTRNMKLRALRQAARHGFDEIDQGMGIDVSGMKALGGFFKEVEAEVATKVAGNDE
jgi:hypothetical protein